MNPNLFSTYRVDIYGLPSLGSQSFGDTVFGQLIDVIVFPLAKKIIASQTTFVCPRVWDAFFCLAVDVKIGYGQENSGRVFVTETSPIYKPQLCLIIDSPLYFFTYLCGTRYENEWNKVTCLNLEEKNCWLFHEGEK